MAVAATNFNAQVGQDQFLQLMAAQMANQNPLEPTSQEDFLGQLAQFSTLNGIEQLNANFSDLVKLQSLTEGASLIGKNVSYFSNQANSDATGIVTEAKIVDGGLVLTVNNEQVALNDISSVMAIPDTDE